MASNAYVMLNVEPEQTLAVRDRLQCIPNAYVREVLGPYDIVLEVEAATPEDLTSTLRSKIRTVPGVIGSITCIWI